MELLLFKNIELIIFLRNALLLYLFIICCNLIKQMQVCANFLLAIDGSIMASNIAETLSLTFHSWIWKFLIS